LTNYLIPGRCNASRFVYCNIYKAHCIMTCGIMLVFHYLYSGLMCSWTVCPYSKLSTFALLNIYNNFIIQMRFILQSSLCSTLLHYTISIGMVKFSSGHSLYVSMTEYYNFLCDVLNKTMFIKYLNNKDWSLSLYTYIHTYIHACIHTK